MVTLGPFSARQCAVPVNGWTQQGLQAPGWTARALHNAVWGGGWGVIITRYSLKRQMGMRSHPTPSFTTEPHSVTYLIHPLVSSFRDCCCCACSFMLIQVHPTPPLQVGRGKERGKVRNTSVPRGTQRALFIFKLFPPQQVQ